PPQQLRIVMREDRWDVVQIHTLNRVERQSLIREADRNAPGTDRFKALGENRAEAGGRALEDAEARIELVGESGRRRRERERDDLAGERCAELRELAFEATV